MDTQRKVTTHQERIQFLQQVDAFMTTHESFADFTLFPHDLFNLGEMALTDVVELIVEFHKLDVHYVHDIRFINFHDEFYAAIYHGMWEDLHSDECMYLFYLSDHWIESLEGGSYSKDFFGDVRQIVVDKDNLSPSEADEVFDVVVETLHYTVSTGISTYPDNLSDDTPPNEATLQWIAEYKLKLNSTITFLEENTPKELRSPKYDKMMEVLKVHHEDPFVEVKND